VAWKSDKFWGIDMKSGQSFHNNESHVWTRAERGRGRLVVDGWPAGAGDAVSLLLDCDAGPLAVKMTGKHLGVAAAGLTGELCWAAALSPSDAPASARIVERDAAAF
jgi:hypothetical protein